jgi:hypothetical protein
MAATQTNTLLKLQEEWRGPKFSEMVAKFGRTLTGPQITIEPDGYDPDRIPSVLYVGIAPGNNDAQYNLPSAKVLRKNARKFLENEIKKKRHSAFWKFALELAQKTAGRDYDGDRPLRNLIWSNICKIGVCKGNPGKTVFDAQKFLAIETLRAEIKTYRPKLVVWVTGDYRVEVIGQVIDDLKEKHWNKALKARWWFYQRKPMNSLPAMLWTYHPQGKKREMTAAWIDHACNLLQRKN